MAKRNPFPTLPARKFYVPSHLPQGLENLIYQQSLAQATRINAPVIAGLQKERKQITRTYRKTKGALQRSLASERRGVASVSTAGLSGTYKKQAVEANQAALRGIKGSLPSLLTSARSTKASSLLDLQKQLIAAKSQVASDTATRVASRENQLYGYAHTELKAKHDQQVTGRQNERQRLRNEGESYVKHQRNLHAAVQAAHNLLAQIPGGKKPWSAAAIKKYGSAENSWQAFTHLLLTSTDQGDVGSLGQAEQAVHVVRHQIADQLVNGLTDPALGQTLGPLAAGLIKHFL